MWRSLVARFAGGEEAAGSNPVIPTILRLFGSLRQAEESPSNAEMTGVEFASGFEFWLLSFYEVENELVSHCDLSLGPAFGGSRQLLDK